MRQPRDHCNTFQSCGQEPCGLVRFDHLTRLVVGFAALGFAPGCGMIATIDGNTHAIERATAAMTDTAKTLDRSEHAIEGMKHEIDRAGGFEAAIGAAQELAAASGELSAMRRSIDRVQADMAGMMPHVEALERMHADVKRVGALRGPMEQMAKLGPDLTAAAGLRRPMEQLKDLDGSMRQVAGLKEPLQNLAALREPLEGAGKLNAPMQKLVQVGASASEYSGIAASAALGWVVLTLACMYFGAASGVRRARSAWFRLVSRGRRARRGARARQRSNLAGGTAG